MVPDASSLPAPARDLSALVDLGDAGLLGAGLDGSLHLWDRAGGPARTRSLGSEALLALDSTIDLVAAAGRGGAIRLLERPGLAPLLTLPGHPGGTWALAFSPDGTRLASTGGDGELAVWRTRDGAEAGRFKIALAPGTALAWSPDGEQVALADQGGALRLVSALTGTSGPLLAEGLGVVRSLGWVTRPDLRLAVGDDAGTVRLLDPSGRAPPRLLATGQDPVQVLAIHPGGRALAVGTRAGAVLLLVPGATDRAIALAAHPGRVTALAFAADGHALVSAAQDSPLRRTRIELPP